MNTFCMQCGCEHDIEFYESVFNGYLMSRSLVWTSIDNSSTVGLNMFRDLLRKLLKILNYLKRCVFTFNSASKVTLIL